MTEHPESRSKQDSVELAVDNCKRNYGEEIDYEKLVDELEGAGWVYRG
jgi:hypothetical protein